MDDVTRELGRRAIAAGFAWVPGSVWRDTDGRKYACMRSNGEGRAIMQPMDGGWSQCVSANDNEWMIPDLSDPATLGCLDAQLAERFGCPVIVTPFGKMFRAWRMLPPDVDEFDYRLCAIRTATTLAGAKVAALEAAPKVAP